MIIFLHISSSSDLSNLNPLELWRKEIPKICINVINVLKHLQHSFFFFQIYDLLFRFFKINFPFQIQIFNRIEKSTFNIRFIAKTLSFYFLFFYLLIFLVSIKYCWDHGNIFLIWDIFNIRIVIFFFINLMTLNIRSTHQMECDCIKCIIIICIHMCGGQFDM